MSQALTFLYSPSDRCQLQLLCAVIENKVQITKKKTILISNSLSPLCTYCYLTDIYKRSTQPKNPSQAGNVTFTNIKHKKKRC